jgi:hypothetical protein
MVVSLYIHCAYCNPFSEAGKAVFIRKKVPRGAYISLDRAYIQFINKRAGTASAETSETTT